MFETNKDKYLTCAVADELSQEHQQFILNFIDDYQEQFTDSVQIFEFYIENNQQWLIQCQEEPNRKTTVFVDLESSKPVNRKVWVMDQGDHVMLLFPEDY
jgi:hypothetical protein